MTLTPCAAFRKLVSRLPACVPCLLLACAAACAGENGSEETILIRSADYMKHEKESRITVLEGNVGVAFRDVTVFADRALLDENNRTVQGWGRVVVTDPKGEITGDYVFYDYRDEYFELSNPAGSVTSKNMIGKAYYSGASARGTTGKIRISRGRITTCGPHCYEEYHVTAESITVYPERKVAAKNACFYIGKAKVLYLPLYVMSLKEEQIEYVDFGYNEQDGFFAIVRYPYLARETLDGILKHDYSSRRGTGYGIEHRYLSKFFGGEGRQTFDYRSDKVSGRSENNFTFEQRFKKGVKTTEGFFSYVRESSLSRFGVDRNVNTLKFNAAGRKRNLNQTLDLTHAFQHIPYTVKTTNMNYTGTLNWKGFSIISNQRYTSFLAGAGINKELYSDLSVTRRFPFCNLTLKFIKQFDLDGENYTGDAYTPITFTLPELLLSFNPAAVGKRLPRLSFLPLTKLELNYGRYTDGSRTTRRKVSRKMIDSQFSKTYRLSGKNSITHSHQYTQFFYDTKDAMYRFSDTLSLTLKPAKAHSIGLNYNNVRDAGGDPVQRDRRAESNVVHATYSIAKGKTTFHASTQYNYDAKPPLFPYSPLILTYTKWTSSRSQLSLSSSYNLDTEELGRTTVSNLISRGKNFRAQATSNWNTEEFELDTAEARLNFSRNNGWDFSALIAYDALNPVKRPLLRDVIAVKRNCCTEIRTAYYTERSEFRFDYVILAFPKKRFGFISSEKGMEIDKSLFQQLQTAPAPGAGPPR
ncbi:MAG: hypothetical protein AB1742_05885 [bacterium]